MKNESKLQALDELKWEKEIALLDGAVCLVARQTGTIPMYVLHSVMEYLDKLEEKGDAR